MAKKQPSNKKELAAETPRANREATPVKRTNALLAVFERLEPWRVILLLALASCLAYANALGGDFLYDDIEQIVENRDLRSWDNLGRAFTTHVWAFRERPEALFIPVSPPYYRPVFTVLLTLGYHLFGLWPQGWHLLSLLLHIGCSVGVYYVVREVTGRRDVAVITALLFAVYSIHVESVSWISGVTDPLFGVFFLASFYLYLRYQRRRRGALLFAALLLFALAAYSKETALSLVGLVFAHRWLTSATAEDAEDADAAPRLMPRVRDAILAASPFVGVAAVYLVTRYLALGGLGWDNPHTYKGPVIHTLFTVPWVLSSYVLHLLLPVDLTIAYNTSMVSSLSDSRFLFPTLALLLVVVGLAVYGKRLSKDVWFALALFLMPLLLVLDLRKFITDFLISDRYLYLPVAGWALLVGLAISGLAQWEERRAACQSGSVSALQRLGFASLALVLLAGLLTAATLRENRSWASEVALWQNAVRIRPDYHGGHYKLGLALYEAKRYPEAVEAFLNTQIISTGVYNALGRCYAAMGDNAKAIENFKRCLEIDANSFDGLNNLGSVYFNVGDYRAAERYFKAALALKPQAIEFHYNLGLCYSRQGRYAEALPEFEQALQYAPNDVEILYELGAVYEQLGKLTEARSVFERGISLSRSQVVTDKFAECLSRLAKS